jgi:hypothetical protein
MSKIHEIANVDEFLNTIKEMKAKRTGYTLETLKFFIKNSAQCFMALVNCVDFLENNYGQQIATLLSFFDKQNYIPHIKQAIGNENIFGLMKAETQIIFFAIYQDIPHMFRQCLQNQNYVADTHNLQLYRAYIRYSLLVSRHQYFRQLVENSIPEIKILGRIPTSLHGIWQVLQNTIEFDGRFRGFVKDLYDFDISTNPSTDTCACLANVKRKLETFNLPLHNEANRNVVGVDCKTLMLFIYFNYVDAFICEFQYTKCDEWTIKILLKFCVFVGNLFLFKHIVENTQPKIKFVDDLPQYVLKNTENMEFLKFIFQGKCRTKPAPMCKTCKVGNDFTQHRLIVHDKEMYDLCKNYVAKKMSKQSSPSSVGKQSSPSSVGKQSEKDVATADATDSP